MTTAFTVLHVIVCIFLIFVVLLQAGKGSDVGSVFGGSSQTVFGSSGAAPFLSKFTSVIAAVFMVTSLVLATLSVKARSSIMEHETGAPAAIPVVPAAPAAAQAPQANVQKEEAVPAPVAQPAPSAAPAPTQQAPATAH